MFAPPTILVSSILHSDNLGKVDQIGNRNRWKRVGVTLKSRSDWRNRASMYLWIIWLQVGVKAEMVDR